MSTTHLPSHPPLAEMLSQGIAHQRRGELDRAEQSYRTLLRFDPAQPQARTHLAGILLATNRPCDAEAIYRQLIAESPRRLTCALHLATALQLQKRFSDACDVLVGLRNPSGTSPDMAQQVEIEKRLGELWYHLQKFNEAQRALEFVVKQTPEDSFSWELLGCVQAAQNDVSNAHRSFEQATQIDPSRTSARFRLAESFYRQNDDASAEIHLRTLLNQEPEHVGATGLWGSLCYRQNRAVEAVQSFHKATMLQPHVASHWSNWGAALQLQGDVHNALKTLDQAVALKPDECSAWTNRAAILQDLQRFDEAERCYETILALKPGETAARHNRALLWLLQGEIKKGLVEHEFRSTRIELLHSGRLQQPWNGERLTRQRLVIRAEQGLGDEVMFARYFAEVQNRATQVRVECDPRLKTLFQRSFPQIDFGGDATPTDAASSELDIALASLPLVLADDFSLATYSDSYLQADVSLRQVWRERLDQLPAKYRVGVSWFGGGTPLTRHKRSIPLTQWNDLLSVPDVAFVNLQYGPHREEGLHLYHWNDIDPTRDLEQFAALLSELDLVISVDNSTVHLAGALGVPTEVLLPVVPDWRWGLQSERTHWYQKMQLIRQTTWNDWSAPVQIAASRLADRLSAPVSRRTHPLP
ncbi:MAG: tetratricopeptide repeat protein [Planctomycetota bacterium]|nr:tetratricopeptide repeat protein [Planctomycetota bacterium]MDA1212413.1 tetratricopeptide repeat protein [Planctomycetota bacterium]